ncbi:MAG: hypothetical protein Q7U54_09760 [Bacteroidales bacterium]|nr:hypothetical protein [Bacteroidales bacterium]
MNSNKTFSILFMLAGEALIIICFLYFGKNLANELLALNIIVSTIIYALFFLDIIFPMVDFKDKSQKTIGSLGLRWLFTSVYTVAAIAAMIISNTVKPIEINSQILIQGIFFFLLSLGLYIAISSSKKVHEVFAEQSLNRYHLDEMNMATKNVLRKIDQMATIPTDVKSRITTIHENLRFISPCNNKEALDLESDFLNEMNTIKDCLFDIPLNYEKIIENIQRCERTYKERKQIFTN